MMEQVNLEKNEKSSRNLNPESFIEAHLQQIRFIITLSVGIVFGMAMISFLMDKGFWSGAIIASIITIVALNQF